MIIIAVSKYEPPYSALPGTLTSAARLAKWARQKGPGRDYIVMEINDGDGTPVTVDRLKKEFLHLKESGPIDRLVVYFAGHGLVRSAADQFWLLSKAAEYTTEAIDLMAFVEGIKQFGIGDDNSEMPKGQLCIIADACRNPSVNAINYTGHPILEKRGNANGLEIDYLMATTLGHYSYQPTAVDGGEPYCLFSDTLSDALEGLVNEVIEDQYHPFKPIISNDLLARYLDSEVPKRAAKFNEKMVPDTSTGLRMNHNYYDILPDASVAGDKVVCGAIEPDKATRSEKGRRLPPDRIHLRLQTNNDQASGFRRILSRGDYLIEKMNGASNKDALVICEGSHTVAVPATFKAEHLKQEGHVWLYNPSSYTMPLFVRQGAGWTMAPLLPHTKTVLQDDVPGEVLLKQFPFKGDKQWDTSLSSMAANSHLKPKRLSDALELADDIRELKEIRPNNANVAGYLYEMAGDRDNVIRTAHYMYMNGYVSIDLALIVATKMNWKQKTNGSWAVNATLPEVEEAQKLKDETNRPSYTRNPFEAVTNVSLGSIFPIFRQGWRMMAQSTIEVDMPKTLREIALMTEGYSAVVLPDAAMKLLAKEFGYTIQTLD